MRKLLLILCLVLSGSIFQGQFMLLAAGTNNLQQTDTKFTNLEMVHAGSKQVLNQGPKGKKQVCGGIKKHASKNARKASRKCYKF